MAAWGPACSVCRSNDCPGCEVETEEEDPELESLERSPEGQDWFPDGRDATPEPPAYLDPLWVLLMRERLKRYQETGEVWFRPSGGPSDKERENANA